MAAACMGERGREMGSGSSRKTRRERTKVQSGYCMGASDGNGSRLA
jgi:hypothetical protein